MRGKQASRNFMVCHELLVNLSEGQTVVLNHCKKKTVVLILSLLFVLILLAGIVVQL
jgi:hypothetical protein